MNLSGILIISTPSAFETLISTLNALPGVEVHHTDRTQHRMIVVQEAESVHDEISSLKRIKKLPGVILAEMVYHYFGDAPAQDSTQAVDTQADAQTASDSLNEAFAELERIPAEQSTDKMAMWADYLNPPKHTKHIAQK